MLNNEAGRNYVVLACRLWGIPRPGVAGASSVPAAQRERRVEHEEGGGTEYENGINIPMPKGRLHYGNRFGHGFFCLGLTTKKGNVLFIMRMCVFITPLCNLRCIMMSMFFFILFFWCSKSFQYTALRCNVWISLLAFGQFILWCFWSDENPGREWWVQ